MTAAVSAHRMVAGVHGPAQVGHMRDADAERRDDDSDLDPMVAAYMAGIDVTLLRENLKLTPTQRVEKLMALQRLAAEGRKSGVGSG